MGERPRVNATTSERPANPPPDPSDAEGRQGERRVAVRHAQVERCTGRGSKCRESLRTVPGGSRRFELDPTEAAVVLWMNSRIHRRRPSR
jgi:hypothetical protein